MKGRLSAELMPTEEAFQRWGRNDLEVTDLFVGRALIEIENMGATSRLILQKIYKERKQHNVVAQELNTDIHSLRHRIKWIRQEIADRASAASLPKRQLVIKLKNQTSLLSQQ